MVICDKYIPNYTDLSAEILCYIVPCHRNLQKFHKIYDCNRKRLKTKLFFFQSLHLSQNHLLIIVISYEIIMKLLFAMPKVHYKLIRKSRKKCSWTAPRINLPEVDSEQVT